jgi:hypothetical protein
LIANDKNRVRWLVLGLSQDGACIDLYENHSENSLKGDLSNDTTVNPPLFSLVNTFKSVEALYPSPPFGVDSAQGEEFAWTIPILPNNPAQQ